MPEAKPLKPLAIEDVLRFWKYVDRTDPHWEWTGRRTGNRQTPAFAIQNRHYSARRLAYELTKHGKPLPKTKRLWATCGTPNCLNPEHMSFTKPLHAKCRRGHKLTAKNVYLTTQGKRACRRCLRKKMAERKTRYLAEGRGWGKSYTRQAA